jgi:hypothetical protein
VRWGDLEAHVITECVLKGIHVILMAIAVHAAPEATCLLGRVIMEFAVEADGAWLGIFVAELLLE